MNYSDKIASYIHRELKRGVPHSIISERLKNVLNKHSLINILPVINKKLLYRLENDRAYEEVILESPFEIDGDLSQKIVRSFGITETPKIKINKDLLAGFRLTHNGVVYEASARNELKKILK